MHKQRKRIVISQIFVYSFIIRLLFLIVIIVMAEKMESGFIGSTEYYDDFRYESGGAYYAEHAKNLIDLSAFTKGFELLGDKIGYRLGTPFSSTPLWYWVVCIIMYLTKTVWSVRILNIFFSSLAIIYIYKFTEIVYGSQTAIRTAFLMNILPYPIIFSCFGYKDHLVMLCTFYILCKAVEYRYKGKLLIWNYVSLTICLLILLLLRSGFSVILLTVAVGIALIKNFGRLYKYRIKILVLSLVAFLLVGYLLIENFDVILYKLQFYLTRHENTLENTSIALLTINGLSDFYKFPFTYLFSCIMPIGLGERFSSWYGIVANFNIIMAPIAVGSAMYFLRRDKPDTFVFWSCFSLYAVSIITSLNIFRHYYSLLPFVLIAFSDFTVRAKKDELAIMIFFGGLYIMALIIFYLM